jgi:hypothetical protein
MWKILCLLQATDECGFNAIAYEFVKEALLLYENDITDSKVQVTALTSVVGTLLNCVHFPTDDYEALITKVRLPDYLSDCLSVCVSVSLFSCIVFGYCASCAENITFCTRVPATRWLDLIFVLWGIL